MEWLARGVWCAARVVECVVRCVLCCALWLLVAWCVVCRVWFGSGAGGGPWVLWDTAVRDALNVWAGRYVGLCASVEGCMLRWVGWRGARSVRLDGSRWVGV